MKSSACLSISNTANHETRQSAGVVPSMAPVSSWQAEHEDRQARLVIAIDKHITEHDAELLDSMDNLLRLYWSNHQPLLIISKN